jgi:hypothetical protein
VSGRHGADLVQLVRRALGGHRRKPGVDFKPHTGEQVAACLVDLLDELQVKTVDLRQFGEAPSVHIEPQPEQLDRLGRFLIVVYETPADMPTRMDQLEDANGFRWEYGVPERGDGIPFWGAEKAYGNVLFSWSSPAKGHVARLAKLDRLRSRLS